MLDKYFDLFVAFIVILIAAIVSIILYFIIRRKKRNQKTSYYDERQTILRKEASEISFTVLLIYLFACWFIDFIGVEWYERGIAFLFGVLISLGVFMVTAILKNAFLKLNENRKTFLVLSIIWVFVSGQNCVFSILLNSYISNGKLTFDAVTILIFVIALASLIAQLIVNHRIKAEEKEDGAE